MSGRRILSQEQLDRMAEMRERGRSYGAIALHFSRHGTPISAPAIRWQCLRVGAFPNRKPPGLGRKTNGSRGKAFTPDEDRIIRERQADGARISAIAHELGRPSNSVLGRILTLASYEAYEELGQA